MSIKQRNHLLAYTPCRSMAWDDAVKQARNGHFMFQRSYMDYHADRFDDASYMLMRDNKVIAVLPAHREGDKLISHNGLSFGGWIQAPRCLHHDIDVGFELLGDEMLRNGFKRLIYTPSPYPYHCAPCGDDLYLLEKLGARCIHIRLSAFVALTNPLKRSKGFVQRIRRGERLAPGTIEETTEVERFWEHLNRFLADRHGAKPVHTADEMQLLKNRFPENIRLFILQSSGDWLAGGVIFLSRNVLRFQYCFNFIKSNQDALTIRLQEWVRLQESMQRPWLDLGTSMDPDTGKLASTLHLHKEIFGAHGLPIKTLEWLP